MNHKKVKVIVDGKTIEGILEEDKNFYGGSKVTYEIDEKTKGIISIKFIKIL